MSRSMQGPTARADDRRLLVGHHSDRKFRCHCDFPTLCRSPGAVSFYSSLPTRDLAESPWKDYVSSVYGQGAAWPVPYSHFEMLYHGLIPMQQCKKVRKSPPCNDTLGQHNKTMCDGWLVQTEKVRSLALSPWHIHAPQGSLSPNERMHTLISYAPGVLAVLPRVVLLERSLLMNAGHLPLLPPHRCFTGRRGHPCPQHPRRSSSGWPTAACFEWAWRPFSRRVRAPDRMFAVSIVSQCPPHPARPSDF